MDYLPIGCSYVYDVTQCHREPEEENYEIYASNDATRSAIHVGKRPFLARGWAVAKSMAADIFQSQKPELEFLLNNYWVRSGRIDVLKSAHHFHACTSTTGSVVRGQQ